MENLKTLVYRGNLTPYQKALAQREFEGLIERLEIYEKVVKNNAVLQHVVKSVCGHPKNMVYQIDNKQFCEKCNSWLEF